MLGYREKKYTSLEAANKSAAWAAERFGGLLFKGMVWWSEEPNFRVGVFNESTGKLMHYEKEWGEECRKCGTTVVVDEASKRHGKGPLCKKCK